MKNDKKSIIGWIGVFITLTLSSIWAYWGAIENFHEGWYSTSIWENLFMLFFQYLLFTIIFVSLAVIILKWKKIGLILHFIVAAVSVWFFFWSKFQCYRINDCNSNNCSWVSVLLWRAKAKEMDL